MGAGFWTNLGDSFGASYRTERGWPRDAFFAKGHDRAICDRHPKRTTGHRAARPIAELRRRKPMACSGSVADVVAATGDKAKVARGN